MIKTFEQRFLAKINHQGPLHPELGNCWIWTAKSNCQGYGTIFMEGHKMVRAHRLAYVLAKGPIPNDICVLHKCDNPSCVNPAHLFLGTHAENMQDKKLKGRNRVPFGERHSSCKLTAAQVVEIRICIESGETQREVARRFNVSQPAVRNIYHRKTWKHIA